MDRLKDKVVLLTGTSQGLGAEVMKLFAREGAKVAGTARRQAKVQELVDELNADGYMDLLALKQDVSSREDWEAVVKTTVEAFGRIDILVNNAAQVTNTDILHCTEEEV